MEYMFNFLDSKKNADDSIVTFENGISEMVMDNLFNQKPNQILLYNICTLQPVLEDEKSIWLGGEEIRCEEICNYQTLVAECEIDMQVVMDSGRELVKEEKLGWEKVDSLDHCEFISESVNKQTLSQATGDILFGGAK